jgi:predicted NAD/FAD-dependent oxidoreductase
MLGTARLHASARVVAVQPHAVTLEDGRSLDAYERVIGSVPAPQAVALLDALPALREKLAGVRYRPMWSFLMRWDGGPTTDVIRFDDHLVQLAVRQPAGGAGLWTVHSSHEFAETYLDAHVMEASTRAASALLGLLGLAWPVEVEASHLWRYAWPVNALGESWLDDPAHGIMLIGDGIAGAGVEPAWESGMGAAQAILASAQ